MDAPSHHDFPSAVQLSTFQVARFRLTLKARTGLALPEYKGSALRGGFGHVFRRIACLGSEGGSGECLLGERCVYHYIFETPPPAGSVVLGKIPTAPHPFILEPPLETKRFYEPGEQLVFRLVLIGKAIDYLAYFIYAFDELGRVGLGRGKGRYTLETVASLDANGTAFPLYGNGRKALQGTVHPLTVADLPLPIVSPFLTIRFLTPTRLKFADHLSDECEFHVLMRSLLRRTAMLNYFHCGGSFPTEQRELVDQARAVRRVESQIRWVDWERFSNRQQARMLLGGIVGRVTFQGEYAQFLPYLVVGTYTHVGKAATFGLGQYEVVTQPGAVAPPS